MDNLILTKTKDSLEIDFNCDTGVFYMSGNSYPENATSFFVPVFEWIEKYIIEKAEKIELYCKIDYFNTSTSKCLLELADILEGYSKAGGEVKVKWYYKKGDIDTQEAGEELFEDYEIEYEILEY